MLSLTKALPTLPTVLVDMIESYLTLKDFINWRATHTQAYYDVEDLTQRKWVQFCGLVKLQQHSWFLNFLSQTYQCAECDQFDKSSPDAEAVQLCQYCFVLSGEGCACEGCKLPFFSINGETCAGCKLPFFSTNGETCAECDTFFCDDCNHAQKDMWINCQCLFCFSGLDNHNE